MDKSVLVFYYTIMRRNIVHAWANELTYEIREIVEFAKKVTSYWVDIIWENIWDPVAKWEPIPEWMKDIVKKAASEDSSYWYCPTRWLDATREWIASFNPKITKDDIIFFNWLWDTINKIYSNLDILSRVIWPNPAYSTHSSAEAHHAGSWHITYRLDPDNDWNPDLEELENKVKFNPNVAWILVINPDNPTWAVFKREILEQIIDIARRYELFVVFDEIYEKLVYDEANKVMLKDIIWDVPGISMRWASKDLPWPGARCWWIEVFNQDKDENFKSYIKSILNAKMLEVCSTTLPQKVIPEIYSHPEYNKYLQERKKKYEIRAKMAKEILGWTELISLVEPKWAFYLSITFNLDKFKQNPKLEIKDTKLKEFIESSIENVRFDKRFCYYLIAAYGICTVPLSWFNSTYDGFRMTLLENDIDKFRYILETIKKSVIEYGK